jgi:hypothetical protein
MLDGFCSTEKYAQQRNIRPRKTYAAKKYKIRKKYIDVQEELGSTDKYKVI